MAEKEYEMVGRPVFNSALSELLMTYGVGSTFEADFDRDTEKQLVDQGCIKVVKAAAKEKAASDSKEKSGDGKEDRR